MFWVITASVFVGMILSAALGLLVMRLTAVPSRASEPIRMHDRT